MCGRGNEYQDFWKLFNFIFSIPDVEFTEACRTGSVEEAENLKADLSLDEVKKIVNQHQQSGVSLLQVLDVDFFCLTKQVDTICLESHVNENPSSDY